MAEDNNGGSNKDVNYTGLGVGLGMLFGASLGLIIWLATDSFVFFPVFVGAGLSIGLAVGASRDQRES
jgi:hypothetical protein